MNDTKIEEQPQIEIREEISKIFEKVRRGKGNYVLSENEEYFLVALEDAVEKRVIGAIKSRQEKMLEGGSTKLKVTGHGYKTLWGDAFTPGCRECLDGTNTASLRSVSECNLNCRFCYYYGDAPETMPDDMFRLGNILFTEDDLKMMFDKQGSAVSGIAWVYYEPFMNFEKHPDIIRYIADKGIHQWMYTNGTLCTREQLKLLADAGLPEIRFNLAATNCSQKVLDIMKDAREFFEYMCVESPMYREYYDVFVSKREAILATGVDHINCAELHLEGANRRNFAAEEPIYRYKREYISPISSRHYTYDIIELAEREGWEGVTINDCSNQAKFYRGMHNAENLEMFGANDWFSQARIYMDEEWYIDAVSRHKIGTP